MALDDSENVPLSILVGAATSIFQAPFVALITGHSIHRAIRPAIVARLALVRSLSILATVQGVHYGEVLLNR